MSYEPSRPSRLDKMALSKTDQIVLTRFSVLILGGALLARLARKAVR